MRYIYLLLLIVIFSSCKVHNKMFKLPDDYQYAVDTSQSVQQPYLLTPEDKLEFHIFSNDGFKLIDVTGQESNVATPEQLLYTIDDSGRVKLPVIGMIKISGLTISQAEDLLQQNYSRYYNNPFVVLKIMNRQALVFFADGGRGVMINLPQERTTLFEALALAGGITDYSKTYNIKIVRGDLKHPLIYHADLSTVEGLQNSELKILPKDIIYVDTGFNVSKRLTGEILPFISIFTGLIVVLTYIQNTK